MKNPWIEKRQSDERRFKKQMFEPMTINWGSCPMIEINFTVEYQPYRLIQDGVVQYTPLQRMQNEEDAKAISFVTASGHTIELKDAANWTYVTVA